MWVASNSSIEKFYFRIAHSQCSVQLFSLETIVFIEAWLQKTDLFLSVSPLPLCPRHLSPTPGVNMHLNETLGYRETSPELAILHI